ncbi:arginase [Herbihabitans rhizosphaerae]|uniref:Arginase n=1 Tax=Herbihabitans rhizosphaerae TaxID=1872711 RepID=A0A4Q7KRV1_9PSEU|nr:arginase family protein [Herbihabitans rhizosphaerae]RZS39295.1 arginase [Herbihabitans rhizosphaerae]
MIVHAVPQRRGALVDAAAGLPAGCRALARLAGEVLGTGVHEIPVSDVDSPRDGGIANRDALLDTRAVHAATLSDVDEPVLTIGGDCSVDQVPIVRARREHGPGLAVVWFDAHADLNTPKSSPSGAYHGMVLRSIIGDGDPEFTADPGVDRLRVALAGSRSLDPAERELAGANRPIPILDRHEVPGLAEHLGRRGPRQVYVHIDLDVLDPGEFGGMTYPEPDGWSVSDLVDAVRGLSPQWTVVGAAVTECVTSDAAELRVLAPLLEVLGEVLHR